MKSPLRSALRSALVGLGVIPDPSVPNITGSPVLSGIALVGWPLTTTRGTGTGFPASAYSYQWKRDGVDIVGAADTNSYTLIEADLDTDITCLVTWTNSEGSDTALSNALTVKAAPANTVAPAVTGTPAVASTLTCSTGTWTGSATITYAYQWLADDVEIVGATSSTYTPVIGDVGAMISCEVTASNGTIDATEESNTVGPVTEAALYSAETLAYQARVEDEGGTLSSQALATIDAFYAVVASKGKTISNGWAFGNDLNHDDRTKVINLAAGKPKLIPVGTLNPLTANSSGMLAVRIDGASQGYITEDASGLFSKNEDSSVLMLAQGSGDPENTVWGRQTTPRYFSQATSTSFNGNVAMSVGLVGGFQHTEWGTGGNSYGPANTGGRDPNGVVDPAFMWIVNNADGSGKVYHCGDGSLHDATLAFAGDPAGKPFRLCDIYNAGFEVGDIGWALLIRIDGTLSDADRLDIFNAMYHAWQSHGESLHITGNSVTVTANTPSVTSAMSAHPKQAQRFGIYNSIFVNRFAQGGMRLPKFTPTGYVLHPSASADADVATTPINTFDWFRPTIWLNDENQNWTSYSGGQPWAAWKHAHDAIATYLAANYAGLRVIVGTQMPMQARNIPPNGSPFLYSQFAVSPGRSNLLPITQAIRAEAAWGGGIPTVVAELYGTGNLGWDTGDDGDPPDPYNDPPNGNPIWFPTDDAQHPNDSGHLDWMWELVYKPALLGVLPLRITQQPASTSKPTGVTHTFAVAIGAIVTYQWEINTGSGWSAIGGATSSSYTTPTLVEGDDGNQYRVVITSLTDTVTSDAATLTIAEVFGVGSASIGSTFMIG